MSRYTIERCQRRAEIFGGIRRENFLLERLDARLCRQNGRFHSGELLLLAIVELLFFRRHRRRCFRRPRGSRRFGSRLERVPEDALPKRRIGWDVDARAPEFRLTMSNAGVIDNLLLRETAPRSAIAKGERSVQFADRSVTYRSIDELMQAEARIANALASGSRAKQSLGVSSKGFRRC